MKKLKNVLAVTLSAAMLLSLVACDNLGSSSKKSKKDSDDTDAVVEAAEDYTKVLKDFDLKKIEKLSTEVDEDMLDDLDEIKSDEKAGSVASDILKTVKFTIDEDSAELDDDEASIDVTFECSDPLLFELDSIDYEVEDEDDDDSDEFKIKGKFTIDFDVDDDEYLVSNADKVLDKFYGEIFGDDFVERFSFGPYGENDWYSVNPASVSLDIDGDNLKVAIEFGDYSELDGMVVEIEILDPEVDSIFEDDTTFKSNTTFEFDYDLTKSPEGYYDVWITFEDGSYMTFDTIKYEPATKETEPAETRDPSTLTDTELYGSEVLGTYVNPFFNMTFEIDKSMSQIDAQKYQFNSFLNVAPTFMYASDEALTYLDNGGAFDDDDVKGLVMAIVIAPLANPDMDINEFAEALGSEATNIGGADVIYIEPQPANQTGIIMCKDGYAMLIFVNSDEANRDLAYDMLMSVQSL